MATLATETWTGTNGAAWPAQWSFTGADSGTGSTIQSNAGSQNVGTTGNAIAYMGSLAAFNTFDVTVSFTTPATLTGWAGIGVGGNNFDYYPTSGYNFQCVLAASGTTLVINRTDSIGASTQKATAAFAFAASTTYNLRFQKIAGGVLNAKVWTGTEPGSWNLTYTDPSPYTTGLRLLLAIHSTGTAWTGVWDNLTLTDGATGQTASAGVSGSGTLTATLTPKATVAGALSATGVLSASSTPASTAAAGLSATGVLTTTLTPRATVTAALSGSGTLAASLTPRAIVAATLTATGALTATNASGLASPAALSGTGTLTATTVSRQLTAAALASDATLTATTRTYGYVLRGGPVSERYFRMAGRGLFASASWAQSLLRIDGQWIATFQPTAEQVASADRFYQGGHTYFPSDADRADLAAAGFGDLAVLEEIK